MKIIHLFLAVLVRRALNEKSVHFATNHHFVGCTVKNISFKIIHFAPLFGRLRIVYSEPSGKAIIDILSVSAKRIASVTAKVKSSKSFGLSSSSLTNHV